MGAYFARLDELGWLGSTDPEYTATFYNWLVMGQPVNEAMLLGDEIRPDEPERRRRCAEAVRIFLAAFAVDRPTDARRAPRRGRGARSWRGVAGRASRSSGMRIQPAR